MLYALTQSIEVVFFLLYYSLSYKLFCQRAAILLTYPYAFCYSTRGWISELICFPFGSCIGD